MLVRKFLRISAVAGLSLSLLSSNLAAYAADLVTPSPTPSISPTDLPLYNQPKTVDRLVPKKLNPALVNAKRDRPKPYLDRCHTQQNLTVSTASCLYGDATSKTTVVLFGDSHALSWFPAIEKLAIAKKWRLYSLTMSSCWPAAVPAWNSKTMKVMKNCSIWRASTLGRIAKLHPSLLFVAGTRGFATVDGNGTVLTGDARTNAWLVGMKDTLDKLKVASQRVVLISDTPVSAFDPPICLLAHPTSVLNCSTSIAKAISLTWLAEEREVASEENVFWVDPTLWVCPTDPCSPISGNTLIYADAGHLTASFAVKLEKPLWKEVSAA